MIILVFSVVYVDNHALCIGIWGRSSLFVLRLVSTMVGHFYHLHHFAMVYTSLADVFVSSSLQIETTKLEKEIQDQTDESVLFYNKGL